MRIVFGGQQLLDDRPMSYYVPESGLTVHLIARSAAQIEQPLPAPNIPDVNSSQNGEEDIFHIDLMNIMEGFFGPSRTDFHNNTSVIEISFGTIPISGGIVQALPMRSVQTSS